MFYTKYPSENPEFEVRLEDSDCGYGNLTFYNKNENGFHEKPDYFLRHSKNVLERVFSGEFPSPAGKIGTSLKNIYLEYSPVLGVNKIPENLAYALLINYPKYFDHEEFHNGFKPMDKEKFNEKIERGAKERKFLLTKDDEVEIFKTMNFYEKILSDSARSIMENRINEQQFNREIESLIKTYNNVNLFFNGIVSLNQGIVYDMSLKAVMNKRHSMEASDLFGVGFMCLCKAINNFDVTKGFRFSTYACNSIYRAIGNYFKDETKHKHLDLESYFESENRTGKSSSQEYGVKSELVKSVLDKNLAGLSSRELIIMRGRFRSDGSIETLLQLGERLGLSKERIRQIENNALKKIKDEFQLEYNFKIK